MTEFSDLDLTAPLREAIAAADYTTMTPIQAASLPPILAGQDVIGQAKTGSGKTLAFALGILRNLEVTTACVQGLVLCPTRELADQVSREIRRLARFMPNVKVLTLCGGIPLRTHLVSLQKTPHVIVATPGRLLDLQRNGALVLADVKVLVLDEADRMLDMGFADEFEELMHDLPEVRQTLLFSATYPPELKHVSAQYQRDPLDVSVVASLGADEVEQLFYTLGTTMKFDALKILLGEFSPRSVLIFCNTKHAARGLAEQLDECGHAALALHGDLEQRDRDEVLLRFANQSCCVLVATDVAARGLDIKAMPLVVNFDIAADADIHLHRIGRTGRAGARGRALTLCANADRARGARIAGAQSDAVVWRELDHNASAHRHVHRPEPADMVTLVVDGGRQDKLRAGDLLGALTGDVGIKAGVIGKIDIFPTRSYVACHRNVVDDALRGLRAGKIKGRKFRIRRL